MEAIVPRWEWRTFGADLGTMTRRFASFGPGTVRESDEIYILSARSDHNTKIRNGLLDVKALRQVDAHGLELWTPVMKTPFPLAAETIARVYAAWRVEVPPHDRAAFALDQFLAELVVPSPHLRVVPVRKVRKGYTINACIAESAEIVADGRPVDTVAVESDDQARVLATVRELDLEEFPNINYVRGLKQLVGMSG